jgi:hypothetical protein
MEITYEMLSSWFDGYFEQVRTNQGSLETVRNLGSFFTSDFELRMHTGPSQTSIKMSRDELLLSFVHPGLREDIVPRYYVIDLRQMIVVVQFEIRFYDEPVEKHWSPIQASAHYHLTQDGHGEVKIERIEYWTEALAEDIFEIWSQRRAEALTKHAMAYLVAR